MKKILFVFTACTTLFLTGCIHPFKADTQQGNIVTQAMVDQLKPGMTDSEVIDKLGSPVLINTFSDTRYDYVYTNQIGHGKRETQRLTCYFENHKLVKVTGTLHPEAGKTP